MVTLNPLSNNQEAESNQNLCPVRFLLALLSPELKLRECYWQFLAWISYYKEPNQQSFSQTCPRPRHEEFSSSVTRSMFPMEIPYPVKLTIFINHSKYILWFEGLFEVGSYSEISPTNIARLKPCLKL